MNALPIPLSPTAQATIMLQQQASNIQMQSGMFIPPQMMNPPDPSQFITKHETPSPRSNNNNNDTQQQNDHVKNEVEKSSSITTTPQENTAMEST